MSYNKSVCVDVGSSLKVVDNVKWNTTAGDVIQRLYPSRSRLKRCALFEEWRGCSRPLKHDENITILLDQWGYNENREDRLMLLKLPHIQKRLCLRSNARYRCGKVAAKKRRVSNYKFKTKKNTAMRISSTIEKIQRLQNEVLSLTMPKKLPEELKLPIDASSLPPELEQECVALQEQHRDEKREHEDLERRKNELSGNVRSQEQEMETLGQTISLLEAKVMNEQHKLTKLLKSLGPPELTEALKEVTKLQDELKVRTKLNKLQSAKLQELGNTVTKTDEELKRCMQSISTLTLSHI